jgi:fumarate reductase subunit D
MSKANEPFWWSLFSAGGELAALLMPALIVVTGFVIPAAARDDSQAAMTRLHDTIASWPVRIVLFGVLFLSLFHCAHRIRHTLVDMGLRRFDGLLKLICYPTAVIATIISFVVLIQL